jgi:hypothetical protein
MHDNRVASTDTTLVAPVSRRGAILGTAAGLLTAVGALRLRAAAQDATPEATPVDDQEPTALFVQSGFRTGTLEPKPEAEGIMVLTLQGAPPYTVFFGDRPNRVVGAAPTQRVLDALGISPEDPPNAALVVEAARPNEEDPTDTIVLELIAASYDPAAETLTYDVRVLAEVRRLPTTRVAFVERPRTGEDVPASFGPSSLFIDSAGCSIVDPRC